MTSGKARSNAPTSRQYRDLLRSARKRVDSARSDTPSHRLECEFVLRLIGELGMYPAEVAHIKESWVDYDQLEIQIPEFELCEKGNDGGPCGYCKKQAEKRAEKSGTSYEKALRDCWKPVNEFAVRTIPFGWDTQLIDVIEEYLLEHGEYPLSRVSINRRVDEIADESRLMTPDDITAVSLREHAAFQHAAKGMSAYHLTEFMGWGSVEVAMNYIEHGSADLGEVMERLYLPRYEGGR